MPSDDEPVEAPLAESLQFDHAEFADAPAATVMACAACRQPIAEAYFEIQGRVLCGRCRDHLLTRLTGGSALARFGRAAVYGAGAALSVIALCFVARSSFGSLMALLFILAGYLIGVAVRKGAGVRGGWPFQVLAMFLTYSAIVGSMLPSLLMQLSRQGLDVARHLPAVVALAYEIPFLLAGREPLGLIIVGVALWQAWRANRRLDLPIRGPFQVSGSGLPPADEELAAHA
jgi:hypothetical protein